MKIAILIGIDEYEHLNSLPGCKNDVLAMSKIIEASKQFEVVKKWSGKVPSSDFKDELTQFIKKYENTEVTELLFYFTGHGSFHENDFYYLLSDYNEEMRRKSSLQNSEIDSLIKVLRPSLVIKVIDACQSGIPYIKTNNDVLKKYYEDTTASFKKCYFLHSSMIDQYSFQDGEISFFTKSFLKSLQKEKPQGIRYKDIIDQISDDFQAIPQQTPFFITQADFTEVFIIPNKQISNTVRKYVTEKTIQSQSPENSTIAPQISFIERIKEDSKQYATPEELYNLIDCIKLHLDGYKLKNDLLELFNLKILSYNDTDDLPNKFLIGKWLQDNKSDEFAKPTFEQVSYQEEVPKYIFSIADMMTKPKFVTKNKDVLNGYEITADVKFISLSVRLNPIYPNIPKYELLMPFIFSKKEIRFFYAITNYKDTSWKDYKINTNFSWNSKVFLIKAGSEIISFLDDILSEFERFIMQSLKMKFPNNN